MTNMFSGVLRSGGALILPVVFSIVLLHYAPIPYAWIFGFWSIGSFLLLRRCLIIGSGNFSKFAFLNLALVFGAMSFAELLLAYQTAHPSSTGCQHPLKSEFKTSTGQGFIVRHPFLGYVPVSNQQVEHVASYPDGSHFSALYTITLDGLRLSNPNPDQRKDKSLVFFGCSYTFGEAVNDEDTLPYQTGVKLDNTYQVYNFGFEGYGPTQMLSELQHGIVEKTVTTPPTDIFYQAIYDHVNRVSTEQPWIRFGPRYAVENGQLVSEGQFGDASDRPMSPSRRRLGRSHIFNRVMAALDHSDSVRLYFAIVQSSIAEAKKIYPEARFHILFWDTPYPNASHRDIEHMKVGFKAIGADVWFVSEIIPDFDGNIAAYVVKNNGHPNALAYSKIATFFANKITALKSLQ